MTKKEYAESLRRLARAWSDPRHTKTEVECIIGSEANRMEMAHYEAESHRLDPPKPRWPQRVGVWTQEGVVCNQEAYPAGIVGPVVEALRHHDPHDLLLAAFDEACK